VIPPVRRIAWGRATRIVATRYPPINLFERLSPDPAVWDALLAAELLVNPRIRDQAGEIHLVRPEDRVSGPGASFVMASFTHLNPRGSRFSDGTYGVYYAANDLATAVAETTYHFARFARDAQDPPRYENVRVLVGRIDDRLHDLLQAEPADRAPLLDPDSYGASQSWARTLREGGSRGIHYPSVRHPAGRCVAVFRPRSVGLPRTVGFLQYHWDGSSVRRYFDFGSGTWTELPVQDHAPGPA
jgi:hypothetical protein